MARLRRAVLGSAAKRAHTDAETETAFSASAWVLAASGKASCNHASREVTVKELGASSCMAEDRGAVEAEALPRGMARVAQSSEDRGTVEADALPRGMARVAQSSECEDNAEVRALTLAAQPQNCA